MPKKQLYCYMLLPVFLAGAIVTIVLGYNQTTICFSGLVMAANAYLTFLRKLQKYVCICYAAIVVSIVAAVLVHPIFFMTIGTITWLVAEFAGKHMEKNKREENL